MANLSQEKAELQATALHAVFVCTDASQYKPWALSEQVIELIVRVNGCSKQAASGALRALAGAGLVKSATRNGKTYWKLLKSAKRIQEIYAPQVLLPVLEKINKLKEE